MIACNQLAPDLYRNGDVEQMLEDIDKVEETPASRFYRKLELNAQYGTKRCAKMKLRHQIGEMTIMFSANEHRAFYQHLESNSVTLASGDFNFTELNLDAIYAINEVKS